MRPSVDSVEVLAWAARVADIPALAEESIDALRQLGASTSPPAQRAAVTALRDLAAEGTRRLEVIGALARLPDFVGAGTGLGLERRPRPRARRHR